MVWRCSAPIQRHDARVVDHLIDDQDVVGRLDDLNLDGMELIADIRNMYDNYGYETQILAASIRSANHMSDCAAIGADVATAPPAVIKKMADHVLTEKGLEGFMKDVAKANIKIV